MKTLKISALSLILSCLFSFSLSADVISEDMNTAFMQEIKEFVSTLDMQASESEATLYSKFITKDADGFIYSIDFLIADDCEIILLSAELEEEFYRINRFNIEDLQTKTLTIAEIKAHRKLKA